MTRNIIFDFGAVLVDWNPHYVFDNYFGDRDKADRFLSEICNMEWNSQMDAGKPFDQGVAELSAVHPEWKKEIELYRDRWTDMMGDAVPGMYDLVKSLKDRGLKIYGLTNWSAETFYRICGNYPVFSLLDGKVVSGEEHVIKLRFGLYDGRTRTLEEVGKEFNVTRERIRQIEAKALRKLRHPSRSRKLKDYLD